MIFAASCNQGFYDGGFMFLCSIAGGSYGLGPCLRCDSTCYAKTPSTSHYTAGILPAPATFRLIESKTVIPLLTLRTQRMSEPSKLVGKWTHRFFVFGA